MNNELYQIQVNKMELEFDYSPYYQTDVIEQLLKSVEIYKQTYMCVILGITHSPALEALKFDKNNWSKMVIKYQSNCLNNIDEIERNIQDNELEFSKNEHNYNVSHLENRPYYVYILLR